jgi:hypothetical protein
MLIALLSPHFRIKLEIFPRNIVAVTIHHVPHFVISNFGHAEDVDQASLSLCSGALDLGILL